MKQSDEENEAEQEVGDFNKPDYKFEPKEHHDWRQQGPYLVCKSCEIEHATYIGMEHLMVGINDQGQPILNNR